VVKEAAGIGLPVITSDVGDVTEVLAGVTPSAVVAFPEPWGTSEARRQFVEELTDQTAQTLDAGRRSNGRKQIAWLSLDQSAAQPSKCTETCFAARARSESGEVRMPELTH
jgi:teichuronic acid biosynthesis glycosyltransferase TuaC